MDALTHRRALIAAAKVALSLSIVACGAATESQDDTTNDYLSKGRDAGATTHECGSPAPKTTTCGLADAEPDAALAPASAESLTCCSTLVTSKEFDAGAGWVVLPEDAGADPDIAACCGAIIAHGYGFDDDAGPGLVPWQILQACCTATGSHDVACTPWGPPAPPAMTKIRREELVALMLADVAANDAAREVA